MMEPRIVVAHREHLWWLLAEAAQLEHMIMCQYLYAEFSLKEGTGDGQRSNYFPAGVQMDLLPFGEQALLHFLYLERPEGMERQDSDEFVPGGTPREPVRDDELLPRSQEFATVGLLYRALLHERMSLLVDHCAAATLAHGQQDAGRGMEM